MHQTSRPAVHERQGRRDQRMLRSPEPRLLGERQSQHHARLAVVWEPLPRRAIDQRVEVRDPPQNLTGNRDGQGLVRRLQIPNGLRGRVERSPAPQDGIEHLQRGPARR